jgi:hypothetical protein
MKTKSTWNVTVGTVKKSQATMSLTGLLRKARQWGDEGPWHHEFLVCGSGRSLDTAIPANGWHPGAPQN